MYENLECFVSMTPPRQNSDPSTLYPLVASLAEAIYYGETIWWYTYLLTLFRAYRSERLIFSWIKSFNIYIMCTYTYLAWLFSIYLCSNNIGLLSSFCGNRYYWYCVKLHYLFLEMLVSFRYRYCNRSLCFCLLKQVLPMRKCNLLIIHTLFLK